MSPFDLAQRFVGEVTERPGAIQHPLIQWWLELCGFPVGVADEVPWCSAFVNGICWELRLPRSKSAAARSWLNIGVSVNLNQAAAGWDVAVFRRGTNPAQGHVGFYAGVDADGSIRLVSGNVHNTITMENFPAADLLGIRRLAP